MQDKIETLREALIPQKSVFRLARMLMTSNIALYSALRVLEEDIDKLFTELDAKEVTPTKFLKQMADILLPDTSAFVRLYGSPNFRYSSMWEDYLTMSAQVREVFEEGEKTDKRKKKQ